MNTDDPLVSSVQEWLRNALQADVTLDDDIFSAGGDSLTAIELATFIEERWNIEVPIDIFFECEDLRILGRRLGELAVDDTRHSTH